MKEVESKEEIFAQEKMYEAVARLRQEKGESEMLDKATGIEDGMEACETLSYEVMKEFVKLGEIIRNNNTLSLAHQLLYRHDTHEYFQSAKARSDEFLVDPQKFDHESYCEGWIRGVEMFWRQVKDRL